MTFESFRSYIEIAYFASGIILGLAGIIGLRQLSLMKFDISTRCRRETMDNSIKIVDRYLDKFVPEYDAFTKQREKEGIPTYGGTIDNLPPINRKELLQRSAKVEFTTIFNELEIISASVMSGLADDDFVYKSIGRSFCGTIAKNHDILSQCTSGGYYPNTNELFKIWRKRLIKAKLEGKRNECDSILNNINDERIPIIGNSR